MQKKRRLPGSFDATIRSGPRPVQPASPFLSLPPDIRQRIYEAAGFGCGKFIHLNWWWASEKILDLTTIYRRYIPGSQEDPIASGLLRTCRTVYEEVHTMLYSKNTFGVTLDAPGGLDVLESLSDAALGEMGALAVNLRFCICHGACAGKRLPLRADAPWFWQQDDPDVREHHQNSWCAERMSRSKIAKATMRRWRRICARLAANVRPFHLSLYLVANVIDLAAAEKITKPLLSLPPLKDAGISFQTDYASLHLSFYHEAQRLRRHARSTVLFLKRRSPDKPFRFLDLPLELQQHILEYSDVAHAGGVRFWFGQDFTTTAKPFISIGTQCWLSPAVLNGVLNVEYGDTLIDRSLFCTKISCGYNTECRCEVTPRLSYFLVNKAFGWLAQKVFWSRNTFSYEIPSRLHGSREADGPLGIVRILRRIPPDGLQRLSHLSLVFPHISPHYLAPDTPGWSAWEKVAFLLAKANNSNLKLSVGLRADEHLHREDMGDDEDQVERRIQTTFARLLRPLALVHGLRAFEVRLLEVGVPEKGARRERELERMILDEQGKQDPVDLANFELESEEEEGEEQGRGPLNSENEFEERSDDWDTESDSNFEDDSDLYDAF